MLEVDQNTVVSQQSPDGSDALLVIDMQKDFIQNSSSGVFLPAGFLCASFVPYAVNCARKSNVPVIWVVREHEPSGEHHHRSQYACRFLIYYFCFYAVIPCRK